MQWYGNFQIFTGKHLEIRRRFTHLLQIHRFWWIVSDTLMAEVWPVNGWIQGSWLHVSLETFRDINFLGRYHVTRTKAYLDDRDAKKNKNGAKISTLLPYLYFPTGTSDNYLSVTSAPCEQFYNEQNLVSSQSSLNDFFPLSRIIRELEAQLEYEREKRERLEAQMDKLRAQIHTLTLQLEDERTKTATIVRITI